jgi:hypothetical protein
MGELCENTELNLEDLAESREQARRVELDLAAIKERLGTSQKPL